MSSTPDSLTPETTQLNAEQTAIACYLGAVVAIGNCVAEVCPAVGTMYRDRLLKLPRRLGFDATPNALQQSREAVETDLVEYAATAGAWVRTGSNRAAQLRDHLHAIEEMLGATADLQRAFLDDLAEHIETAAEVDDEAQLRRSFHRYAAGLRAYSRRTNTEKLATIDDMRRRREEIESWLAEATVSDFVDPETGILNRVAAERRLKTQIRKSKPFCAIVVEWTWEGFIPESVKKAGSAQIMRQLAERLAATIRPYDVIFRWSANQLMTVFEAPESDILARVKQIGGWLGDGTCVVEVEHETSVVKTHANVSLVEHFDEESVAQLIERIESVAHAGVS
ncbi:MAG: diguanylate cyclase [Bryobacteraceae bacterium]